MTGVTKPQSTEAYSPGYKINKKNVGIVARNYSPAFEQLILPTFSFFPPTTFPPYTATGKLIRNQPWNLLTLELSNSPGMATQTKTKGQANISYSNLHNPLGGNSCRCFLLVPLQMNAVDIDCSHFSRVL